MRVHKHIICGKLQQVHTVRGAMTSKNKTSQPDNTPAAEDTPSGSEDLDTQAAEEVDTAGEKTDELEEVTDPIAPIYAAEDYIMEVVSPIFPGLDEDEGALAG